ncbi:MAG: hypothetical protein WBD47_04135, partial [Phormidesmis sp.]
MTMNKQSSKQAIQSIFYLSAIAASMHLVMPKTALAEQISPNPNPAGNAIEIGPSFEDPENRIGTNSEIFNNFGEISIFDAQLVNDGVINNIGTIRASETQLPGVVNNGTISNRGEMSFRLPSSLLNEGRFDNSGTMSLYFSWIENSGYFENNGLIQEEYEVAFIENTGAFVNNSDLNRVSLDLNTGIFVNQGFHDTNGLDAEHYINKASGTVLNNGFTIVRTEPKTILTGFENLGLLKGSGTYDTYDTEIPFVFAGGTVAPGGMFGEGAVTDTAGTLTFNGDAVFESGQLDISIGGFEDNAFDVLDIAEGQISLSGGTIGFSWLDGFDITETLSPGETKTLSFLNADKGISDFSADLDFS